MRVICIKQYDDTVLAKKVLIGETVSCDGDRAKTLHKAGVAKIIDDSEFAEIVKLSEQLKEESEAAKVTIESLTNDNKALSEQLKEAQKLLKTAQRGK